MALPSPIVPANRPQPSGARPADAVAQPAPPVDEGLVEGALRRARSFAADLRNPAQATPWLMVAGLSALLMYSYWVSLAQLPSFWDNPQYQHGWIVPVFTVVLLFWWRQPVGAVAPSARYAGIGLLVASFALRLFCASFRIVTIDMYTFVPALLGVFLLAGGWSMFRWAWAPIASLIFMYPLPDEATRYLLGPLQTVATILSTYGLQTIGLDAFRDGNRIILGDGQVLGVVDACSGLKMLTIFVWLAVMLMMVGGLEWWENLVIAASAIPIALACNALRIAVAGILYHFEDSLEGVSKAMAGIGLIESGQSLAEGFHDSLPAAVLMMLMAVGLLVLEMKILSYLVVVEDTAPTLVRTSFAGAGGVPAGPRPLASGFPTLQGQNFARKPVESPSPGSGENMG